MSRELATVQVIEEIKPIEGADKIVAARVKGWWTVVNKEDFQVGDKCFFFEVDSFLPVIPQFDFLLKRSGLKEMVVDGEVVKGIRLKTIKLKKQLSQGLALPLKDFLPPDRDIPDPVVGIDYSGVLGVRLWEPPIPANMRGTMKGSFPAFIPKTDEERIQNCPDVLDRHRGKPFIITEKLDGTSATYFKHEGVFGVCSRNVELKPSEGNVYWEIAKQYNLEEQVPNDLAIQGEIIGEGIQKNPYRLKGRQLRVFSVYNIRMGKYLNYSAAKAVADFIDVPSVPLYGLQPLTFTLEEILAYADGPSVLGWEAASSLPREGLVFRPCDEEEDTLNGKFRRLSFKVVSNEYLLGEREKHEDTAAGRS
jgi:RNA ligase (TIGR02306 family)